MIRDQDLHPVLQESAEGEMIMAGTLLQGVSGEEVAWVVVENHRREDGNRVTLHAYWHNIFMVSKIVCANDDGTLTWGVTKS